MGSDCLGRSLTTKKTIVRLGSLTIKNKCFDASKTPTTSFCYPKFSVLKSLAFVKSRVGGLTMTRDIARI